MTNLKPKEDFVERDGLVELLGQLGFQKKLDTGTMISMRRHVPDSDIYSICFVFPTTAPPQKCAGFAGMGAAKEGDAIHGSNFDIHYGQTRYGELYFNIKKMLEPICGKIIPEV